MKSLKSWLNNSTFPHFYSHSHPPSDFPKPPMVHSSFRLPPQTIGLHCTNAIEKINLLKHSTSNSTNTNSYFNPVDNITQEMRGPRSIEIWKMGVVNYFEALKLQQKLASERKLNKIHDTLLSLQHPPTYTLGKRRTDHNILVSEAELKAMGAELHYTERGGDVTFHGPHQAILYPIISLRDIGLGARKYVENLESTMIELTSLYGVKARAGETGETGVWVGRRKIGAVGVRISSGITSHGLAFNISPDLDYFKYIVPCGIPDKEVTSLQKEVQQVQILPSDEVIHEQLISCFVRTFGYTDIIWKGEFIVIMGSFCKMMNCLPYCTVQDSY